MQHYSQPEYYHHNDASSDQFGEPTSLADSKHWLVDTRWKYLRIDIDLHSMQHGRLFADLYLCFMGWHGPADFDYIPASRATTTSSSSSSAAAAASAATNTIDCRAN
jgi:hypothetical protein